MVYGLFDLPPKKSPYPEEYPDLNEHQEPIRKMIIDEHRGGGIRCIDVQGGPGAGKSWLIVRIVMEAHRKLGVMVDIRATSWSAANIVNGKTVQALSYVLKQGHYKSMEGENRHWADIDMVKTEFLIIDEASMASASEVISVITKFCEDKKKVFKAQIDNLYSSQMLNETTRDEALRQGPDLTIMLSGDNHQFDNVSGGPNIYEALEDEYSFLKTKIGN